MALGHRFLPSKAGDVHLTHWEPGAGASATVLWVPPFGEEMNKCRVQWARTAQGLARQGLAAVAVDFLGTGDSGGDFRQARLAHWRQDLARVVDWAAGEGAPVVGLVGTRFGALLALELAATLPGPLGVVLWQPVPAGSLQLKQFLRLRMASGLLGGGGTHTVATLMAELEAGRVLEVAGYELHPALAAELQTLDLQSLCPPAGTRLGWFEVGAGQPPLLSRVAVERLADWTEQGRAATGRALNGDTFWSTVEVTVCPELTALTVDFLLGGA